MTSKTVEAPAEAPAEPKSGRKKKLLLGVVVLLVVGAAAWFLVLEPSDAAAEAPEPGAVVTLESINLNLADGRYLKLGLALQATATAQGDIDGAKALDLAISQLSGRSVQELSSAEAREQAKGALRKAVDKAYQHEVMDVYFTEFVMQ